MTSVRDIIGNLHPIRFLVCKAPHDIPSGRRHPAQRWRQRLQVNITFAILPQISRPNGVGDLIGTLLPARKVGYRLSYRHAGIPVQIRRVIYKGFAFSLPHLTLGFPFVAERFMQAASGRRVARIRGAWVAIIAVHRGENTSAVAANVGGARIPIVAVDRCVLACAVIAYFPSAMR